MVVLENNRREYHPAVSILSWLIVALAIELASAYQLPWFALLGVFLLAGREAWQRFVRLLWKARWLWVALILLYAWTVPGTLVWPSDYSPSREGLEDGLIRVARLALMLAALARLLQEFTPQKMAGGIYLLTKPFARLGLDCRALAVRLALTLEYMEQPPNGRKWLDELKAPLDVPAGPDEIRFSIAQAGLRDMLAFIFSIGLLGVVLMRFST